MKSLITALLMTLPLLASATAYNLILENISNKDLTIKLSAKSNLTTDFNSTILKANSNKEISLKDSGSELTRDANFEVSLNNNSNKPTEIKFIRKPVGGDTAYTSIKELLPALPIVIIKEASCFSSNTPEVLSYKNCKFARSLRTHSSEPITAVVKLAINNQTK